MDNLTAVVISFLRPQYTIDCIHSLRKTYPNIHIITGDQSDNQTVKKNCKESKSTYIKLPFDYGVGASRNTLINYSDTKYTLVGDDDFLYDKHAKVDQMVRFLEENTNVDLIGGRIIENSEIKDYQGYIQRRDDHLKYEPVYEEDVAEKCNKSGLRYKKVDLTFNFFVAKTEVLKKYPWDENIKVAFEHSHQFIKFKDEGVRVVFSPDPIVKHKYQGYDVDEEYKQYRVRKSDKDYFFDSLNIDYVIGMNDSLIRRVNPQRNEKNIRIRRRR